MPGMVALGVGSSVVPIASVTARQAYVFLSYALGMYLSTALGPLLPVIVGDLKLTSTAVAEISALGTLGSAVGKLALGGAVDYAGQCPPQLLAALMRTSSELLAWLPAPGAASASRICL